MSDDFHVTFDACDPRALSSFWRDALGYVEAGEQRDTGAVLEDPGGKRPRLFFRPVPAGRGAKGSVHMAVPGAPGLEGDERMAALEAECKRLLALGATRVRRHETTPIEAGHIVMADLEGNEFRLD